LVAAGRREHTVPPEARGQRLDFHLAAVFPDLSRSRLRALIDEGRVQVAGRPLKAAARLRGGEQVQLDIPPPAPASPLAQDLPLTVLFEDAHLVVLDKAAGMVVHPAAGHADGTLVNALLHRVTDLHGIGGSLRPGLVHRLDKDTSGVMVVAKSEGALTALQAAFKGRQVEKTYLALVHGQPTDQGVIETRYGRHPIHRKRFSGRVKEGKPARTGFRVQERFGEAALVEVDLHTGRTHQVRVHLAEAGHPLLCDALYGGLRKAKGAVADAQQALGRQALHAWKLAFLHPISGERLCFEAPLPRDFEEALARLRARPR
jgi:23S rRNA pseudouridine1911/1915/1917 synthase